MTTITKQPNEQYPVAIKYYAKLPLGTSLVSATLSAEDITDPENPEDATNEVLQSPTGIVTGTRVKFGVTGGSNGNTYKITCTVTLDDDSVLEDEITLVVAEE